MTTYSMFKLLHVVGAIAWVGGGIGLLVLSQQLVRARDYDGFVSILGHSKALGLWLFMPAALLTVGFGVALVATEDAFRFSELWILIGFGGIVASGIAQSTVSQRATARLMAIVAEHGTGHPDLPAVARRVTRGSVLEVGLLLVVVWAMVAKPTL